MNLFVIATPRWTPSEQRSGAMEGSCEPGAEQADSPVLVLCPDDFELHGDGLSVSAKLTCE